METAKKLSIEEMKALPFASVIWRNLTTVNDNGITFYVNSPCLVCDVGDNLYLVGGDSAGSFEYGIEDILNDESISFWNGEPRKDQLTGISISEYDEMDDTEQIVFPDLASAITSRGMTFKIFCSAAGIDYHSFWDSITGKTSFSCREIADIANKLNDSVDHIFHIES